MITISFVEGNISVGIELAPGTLDRLKTSLAQLERGVTLKANLDPTPIQGGTRAVEALNQVTQQTANNLSNKLGGAVKAVGATLGTLGVVGAGALVGVASKAIAAGKEFNILQQQVRAGLTAVLGTTAAAEGLLAQVNKLNDTSPFPRSAFLSATQQLVGFGVEAKKVTPIIDSIQQAVAGIGGDKNDIATFTRAFAQIQSQGRLTGDVLFTLGAKGVDAAAIIGKQMGRTGQEIKDSVSNGAIDADKAIDLLTKGLQAKFKGSTDNVAKSFVGSLDRVQARLRDIGADITKVFINPLGGGAAVEGLNNLATGLSNIRKNVIPSLLPGIQTLADLFVKATKAFSDFTAKISSGQVKEFLNVLKELSPIIAAVGGNLVKSLTAGIPLVGNLTSALSGPLLPLAVLAATVPEVRTALTNMAEAMKPAVESLLPALQDLLKKVSETITSLAPLLNTIANAFAVLIQAATPLLEILKFGPVQIALLALVAKMGLVKLGGTKAFQEIGYSVLQASSKMQGAAAGAEGAAGSIGKLAQAGNVGKAALSGLGGVLSEIITPTNFFIAAIGIVINKMASLEAKAKSSAAATKAAITEGLNTDAPDEFAIAMKRAQDKIAASQAKFDKSNSQAERFKSVADPTGGFGVFGATKNDTRIKTSKADLVAAQKELADLQEHAKTKQDVLTQAQEKSGKTAEEVAAKVKELGLTLINLKPDQVAANVKKITDAFSQVATEGPSAADKLKVALGTAADALDAVRSATDAYHASQKALANLQKVTAQQLQDTVTRAQIDYAAALDSTRGAAERVTSAHIALGAAQRASTEAVRHLNELTTQRNRLLADSGAQARELADAESTLARTGAELVDQDERKVDLQRDLANLARDTPDKLAAGDRAIERARIGLNTATREQLNLEEQLHNAQVANVDLTGLTPAQIKLKIAQVRAQVDAQKLAKGTLKTEQQIKDEVETAALNKSDAEQALKDSIQGRADLELSLNTQKREDEQALQALQLDHESSLRRQFEQQQALSVLRTGDTQTARTLRDLNAEIATATDTVTTSAIGVHTAEDGVNGALRDQQTLVLDVRAKHDAIEEATRKIKEHYDDIKTAAQKVREDAQKVQEATAKQLDDTLKINGALFARIGLNSALLTQNPEMVNKLVETILGPTPFGDDLNPNNPTSIVMKNKSDLANILTNHPDQLLAFLRKLGLAAADGVIVNSETFARIGEAGREVVLPLTRPARMVDLLSNSQVLHPVLNALGRISLPSPAGKSIALNHNLITASPTMPISPITRGSGSNVVVGRDDGPMTYGQAREIIALLESNGPSSLKVEAPITINRDVDEEALVKKITKQLERKVQDIMNRR